MSEREFENPPTPLEVSEVVDQAAEDAALTKAMPLGSASDILREMAKVYRRMRTGRIRVAAGARYVWVLAQMVKAAEVALIEARIDAIEAQQRTLLPDADRSELPLGRAVAGERVAMEDTP